jgi:hypothetical protein
MSKYYLPFRLIFLLGSLAFGVTLAVMIGQRLSSEAMAILMGVVAGVVASIPTSLIVVWIAMKTMVKPAAQAQTRPQPAPREEPVLPTAELPRLVLVQQPMQQAMAYSQPGWPTPSYQSMMPTPAPRKFTVIGGNAESEDLTQLQPLEMDM